MSVAFISQPTAAAALGIKHPGVRLLSLGASAPARRVLVARRHDRVRAPAEMAFHDVLVETAADYEPALLSPPSADAPPDPAGQGHRP